MKFLVRKGANLTSRNGSGRTPLDEAKSSRCGNPSLARVIQFLTERQENSHSALSSDEDEGKEVNKEDSDDGSSDEGATETDNDVARFLGLSYSPGIEQALQAIGVVDANGVVWNSRRGGKELQQASNAPNKRNRKVSSKKGLNFGMEGGMLNTIQILRNHSNLDFFLQINHPRAAQPLQARRLAAARAAARQALLQHQPLQLQLPHPQ